MIAHVLLTRFNLPTGGRERYVRAKDGWLRNRIELFERFCVPSVRAQTEPVNWLVYVDPKSPAWLLDRLTPLAAEGLLTLKDREEVKTAELLADIRSLLPRHTTRVITTNLDNDDGLATDFSARVKVAAMPAGIAAIYISEGLILTPSRLYLRTDRANAFCSVVADVDSEFSCWLDWHNRLHRHMSVRQVHGAPGWLQTVHGGNVSNRVRGRLVSPASFRDRFPDLLAAIPEPSLSSILSDAYLQRPGRFVRDAARGSARTAGVRLLGKERFTRLKAVIPEWKRTGIGDDQSAN